MKEQYTYKEINLVADFIRCRMGIQPKIGLILGSGLSQLTEMLHNAQVVHSSDIPLWPVSTVEGHHGNIVAGKLEGKEVIVLQGRVHFYEGFSMAEVTMPVRVMKLLGVEILIVTNAAGAINPDYQPGDVMLIRDHIALPGMIGFNPLHGPNIKEFGVRFPDMSQAYDRKLLEMARQVAKKNNVPLQEGVYTWLSGPSYETPAEIRFLRTIGTDAVGMSTAPETIVANHCGVRVMGLSGISNKANLDGNTPTDHEEVLQAGKVISPKMEKIILGVLHSLP